MSTVKGWHDDGCVCNRQTLARMAETAAKTNSVGGTDVGRCDELDNRRESSVDNDKREDPGNDKSRRNDVTHGQWVAMGVTTSRGPFLASVAPRRWRCQALCDSSRTAVYFSPALYSRAELALTAGRVCRDYACTPSCITGACYARSRWLFLHWCRRELSRARRMQLTVTSGIDDDSRERFAIESSSGNSVGNTLSYLEKL